MIIIGHRGARALEPENTLRAVRKGMECADFVEVDVRLTLDGVPVVIHDPTLDRTTNGKGRVRDFTLEDLRKLDAGLGEKVPLLGEVLQLVRGRCGLVVEIKEEGTEEVICGEIRRERIPDLIIISFSGGTVRRAKELLPGSRTGFISSRPAPDPVDTAAQLGADVLLPRKDILSADLVNRARGLNLQVIPWVLDTDEEFTGAHALGVDGVASDDPCRARKWMNDR